MYLLKYFTAALVLLLILPIYLTTIVLLQFFRLTVSFYLRHKLGQKYGGLLSLNDALASIKLETSLCIHVCLVIKTKQDFNNFVEELKSTLIKNSRHIWFEKLSSLRKTFCGVEYLEKKQFDVDHLIEIVDTQFDVINKKHLEALISDYASKDFGDDSGKFIEIKILKQEVDINGNIRGVDDNSRCFGLLLKVDHALSDGLHIVKFLSMLSGQKTFDKIVKKDISKIILARKCFVVLSKIIKLIYIHMFERRNSGINLSRDMSNGTNLKMVCEDYEKLVDTVKTIKNKVGNVTFSDVLLTALSGSISEFYKKECRPGKMTLNVSIVIPTAFDSGDPKILANELCIQEMKLPLKKPNETYLEKLKLINHRNDSYNRIHESILMQNVYCSLVFFPMSIKSKLLTNMALFDFCFSIVPSSDQSIELFGGKLEHIWGFAPRAPYISNVITAVTHNNRFHLGAVSNNAPEASEEILLGIFKHIELIRDEICK